VGDVFYPGHDAYPGHEACPGSTAQSRVALKQVEDGVRVGLDG